MSGLTDLTFEDEQNDIYEEYLVYIEVISVGWYPRISVNIRGYSDINFYLVFDRRMLGIDTRNIREYP